MATGRPLAEVIQQPADLTLWTFYQWADAERLERHRRRLDRFDTASLTAAATWDGKALEQERVAFVRELRRHPDPEVERRLLEEARAERAPLIERAEGIFGSRERR